MTREIAAHDRGMLNSPHVTAALAIHRAALGLTLVELLERAGRPGPASRGIKHIGGCGDCRLGALCPIGVRLARAIGSRRSRRRHLP